MWYTRVYCLLVMQGRNPRPTFGDMRLEPKPSTGRNIGGNKTRLVRAVYFSNFNIADVITGPAVLKTCHKTAMAALQKRVRKRV